MELPCEKDNEIANMLYQLVKEQSVPNVDTEVFDGDLKVNVLRSS